MSPDPLSAIGYSRVSRPDEAAILANQEAAIRNHGASRGLQMTRIVSEVVSGGKEARSGLNEVMEAAERGEVKLVVFTSLSRMTRGGIESALYILRRLERAGCGWHFTEQPVLDFDAGTSPLARDIILAVLAAVDQDYRRRISAATKAAYARRKALAEARGERVAWGRFARRDKGSPLTP